MKLAIHGWRRILLFAALGWIAVIVLLAVLANAHA